MSFKRRFINYFYLTLICLTALIAITPLVAVFLYVAQQGIAGLNWDFLTKLPQPVGETGGGMANALLGTVLLVAVASTMGIPLGLFTGIYLSEFGKRTTLARITRFSVDMLGGIPSIVVGVFAYTLLVLPFKKFSLLSGAAALALLMIPTVCRTTEEMLRLIPRSMREAGLALGLPRWRVILRIILPAARRGILTGLMLAIARVAGETAPLLFTAFGSSLWFDGLTEPVAALPLQIYNYAISPYEDWHRQAWAGAFLLLLLVLVLNLVSRLSSWKK